MFGIFRDFISGAAGVQDDIDHGGRGDASRWSERQARGWARQGDDNAAAGWLGAAGRAAQDETSRSGRRSWFW